MHIDVKQDRQVKWAFFLAAFCALMMFLALQVLLTCGVLQTWIPSMPEISNLTTYVITLILFVLSFCVCLLIFRRMPMTKTAAFMEHEMTAKAYKRAFIVCSAVLLLMLAARRLVFERWEYAAMSTRSFHMFPRVIGFPLFAIVAAVAIRFGLKLRKDWDVSRRVLYLCTAGAVALNFVVILIMNIFRADIHHGVAYLESIYNVFYGVPYTRTTMGIYGFYGLFLAPVLHLTGGSGVAMHVTMALLQGLVSVLCVYCVWSLTKENYFRVFALLMCCISTLTIRFKNYWQVQPHRVLWPLILLAFVLYLVKKDRWNKKNQFFGYCLCTAAVVWNIESGLFCSIAFAAACVVHDWQKQLWYTLRSLLSSLLHIGAVIGTVVSAILIVNGYNYLCGWRQWLLKDFFFPMFETKYMTGFLPVDMPVGDHAWVYVLVLFGGLLLGSLYMTSFVRGKAEAESSETAKLAPAMMAVAMLGLCNFSYYANRAAYANLDIIAQLAGVATCMLWHCVRQSLFLRSGTREDCVKTITAFVSIVLVTTLAIEAMLFSPAQIYRKIKSSHYDVRSYKQSCELLEQSIPENTFAFGGGISMMYAELGWDPIGHYRDASDLRVGGEDVVDTIVEDVLEQEAFVAYLSTGREENVLEKILLEEPDFVLEKEVDINGKILQYYVRSDE